MYENFRILAIVSPDEHDKSGLEEPSIQNPILIHKKNYRVLQWNIDWKKLIFASSACFQFPCSNCEKEKLKRKKKKEQSNKKQIQTKYSISAKMW